MELCFSHFYFKYLLELCLYVYQENKRLSFKVLFWLCDLQFTGLYQS